MECVLRREVPFELLDSIGERLTVAAEGHNLVFQFGKDFAKRLDSLYNIIIGELRRPRLRCHEPLSLVDGRFRVLLLLTETSTFIGNHLYAFVEFPLADGELVVEVVEFHFQSPPFVLVLLLVVEKFGLVSQPIGVVVAVLVDETQLRVDILQHAPQPRQLACVDAKSMQLTVHLCVEFLQPPFRLNSDGGYFFGNFIFKSRILSLDFFLAVREILPQFILFLSMVRFHQSLFALHLLQLFVGIIELM